MSLFQMDDVPDFLCVNTWSYLNNKCRAVRVGDITNCGIFPEEKFVYIKAIHAQGNNLPLEEAMKYDVFMVHQGKKQS